MALKYIGGGAWLPGIPACDLDDATIKALGVSVDWLVGEGLYEPANKETANKTKPLPQGEVLPEPDEKES